MKRTKILEMTVVIRNLCVFTMILLFSVSVKGDLVPKKIEEFNLKEITGRGVGNGPNNQVQFSLHTPT